MMRIITGKAKGVRLKTLEGDSTRPTSERVKEAVFSMIQFDIEGRTVLDLFAGSGQMSLEALSRGAKNAVMIDRSADAVRVIEENINRCRLADQCMVRRMDYLDFLRRNKNEQYDIIFLDPPYASGAYRPALKGLIDSGILKKTSIIICESSENEIFNGDSELERQYTVYKQSRYSKTVVTMLALSAEVTTNE